MQNRRAIAVAGLAISVFFLALMAWRAQVWHERGWTGLRHLPSPPPSMDLPAFIPKAKGGLIDVVMPGSPAEAAGIRMRDVIESIDGIPISDLRAIHRRGDIARSGDTIVYRIVRGGKPRVVPVRSVSPLTFPNVVAGMVTGVVMMFAFLAIALLVIRSRPTSRPAIVFYWFCVLGCIWSAINAFLDLELLSGDGIYPAFSRLSVFASYLAILFVATAFGCVLLHLALVFPRDLPIVQRRPWIIGWLYALPLGIGLMPFAVTAVLLTRGPAMKVTVGVLLALVAVLLVLRPKRRPWIERAGTLCGIALALILSAVAFSVLVPDPIVYALLVGAATVISLGVSLISALGYSLATIAALILGYRRSTAEEKRQLRWPLWGTLTALGVSIIVLMVLLIPGASQHTAMLLFIAGSTRLVYLLIPVTFAFAILKYRLMDIDVVIKKTVVYSIATGVILVAFFVLVAGLGSFLAARLEIRSQMVTVIATLLLAALFVPLRNRVQRSVERRFFQRAYDASEAERLIQQEIVSATKLEELLPRIAGDVQQALQVRSVVIFTQSRDDDPLFRPAAVVGIASETLGGLLLDRVSMSHLDGVSEASALRLSDEERSRVRRIHAELVVPLVLRGRTRGVMLVGSMLAGRFDDDDRRFLGGVAQQIAFAIENLTVTEEMRDVERALEIQRALLPKALPRAEGIDIEAAWRPARTVGGDYYDVLPLGPSMLGLCIADVAGKGMSAALLMANLQAAVKASATAELAPHHVCAKVSTVVTGTLTGGRFVTFFFATLDTKGRLLRYTNAGHNPPLLLRPDGTVERLARGGPVFARMMHGTPYEMHEAQLQPGDTLVLFTDGVTEARSIDEEEFGEHRLLHVARTSSSAAAVVANTVAEVQRFCGGAAQDDLTMLVVRV